MRWELWAYGLLSGSIKGGSGAVCSWLGLAGAKSVGLDVHLLSFKEFGIVLVSGAAVEFFSYLRQKPLPDLATGNTETIRNPALPPIVKP